jgi:fumarate hydratase subunit alpha
MRTISYHTIVDAVADLCIRANNVLPGEVRALIGSALQNEKQPLARSILDTCIRNAGIAAAENMPICQDTGFAVFFIESGAGVAIEGGTLSDAVNEGTARGYRDGYLRKSIVADPLYDRTNTGTNTPAIVHIDQVAGDCLKITCVPKGGGAENMSASAMLKPFDGEQGVLDFVVTTVVSAGGNTCPPVIVGVGIGGTFELCALLAKKALLRPAGTPNRDSRYAELEQKILAAINASGIGPQGLGGSTTALAVHIETFPCHIASLPVAVNFNCHAARCASITL